MTNEDTPRDVFDKLMGSLVDRLDVFSTRPSTVTSADPFLGDTETYVVQTIKSERGNYGFIQVISRKGGARFVLPPKAMNAIYRQRDAVVKASRSARAKDRWEDLSPEDREKRVAHLRRKPA